MTPTGNDRLHLQDPMSERARRVMRGIRTQGREGRKGGKRGLRVEGGEGMPLESPPSG